MARITSSAGERVDSSPSVGLMTPVESLADVGEARAKALRKLGLRTLGDLLEYFPRDYQFESAELPISRLVENQIQTARGQVLAVDYVGGGRRARFEATIDDGTEKLALAWFNSNWLRGKIHPGMTIRVQGKVAFFRNMPQMVQSRWEAVDDQTPPIGQSVFRPIYPATLRLPSEIIQQIIDANLDAALLEVGEWFSPALVAQRGLLARRAAYRAIHRPANLDEAMRARRRIIYDELMLMQIGLGISRRLRDGRISAPVIRIDKLLDQRIRARFPFPLTNAQQNAVWQIARDLHSGSPMNRLLQGDVGSGKTVVAIYAMLLAVANKLQAALLAPTEVLAEQHYITLSRALAGSNVVIELFTGKTKRKDAGKKLKALAEGKIHLAVGTQALIQRDIEFANLGLVVVDEQHKLGVKQRGVLKGKGLAPHYLVMTATPIPRTLALSYFADFAYSTLDELPPGRQPIVTKWIRPTQANGAYEFLVGQVRAGRQGYIVVPQIDDNGLEDTKSVMQEYELLRAGALSAVRLAVLHGQMKTDEKQQVMADFRDRKIDVLVATTVIEVGIDVPNATVMMIDNAERFGLSQLHQLRGRVGRGSEISYCTLISDPPNEATEARLRAMTQTNDGFEIAEMDLKLRGPGQFFGTRQHGLPEFKLADVSNELELLHQAKDDALALLNDDPRLTHADHRHLRSALSEQIGDTVSLAQIG
ncbi:MAG TPA: ATP-dependent DNA helicase RecG [Tepidisphaeraceae bacterium]|jgi:ATP-dependent DNA helicase RecG|nr:ATP-dependent DNA helicase RecG [Tepidisphaeraceae bacterium]